MINRFRHRGLVGAVAAAAISLMTAPAWASWVAPGYDLQIVKSEQGLIHTSVGYLTNPLWGVSGRDVPVETSFTLPACDGIQFSRLYLDVWGGTNTYTCTVTAALNGAALQTVAIGGQTDTNPTFDVTKTCAYGTGSGMWQIAYAGVNDLLKTDGSANVLNFLVNDPNNQFDGRTICASLVGVYTDPTVTTTLDYYLAEADGTLRRTPGTNNSPSERTLTFHGLDTENVVSAIYRAGYTHGTTNEKDQLYFNGTALGTSSNDVALGTSSDYGPNNIAYDVSSYLTETNTVLYSANSAIVGSTAEGYVRANIALLEVTHAVPEPSPVVLLGMGAATLLLARKIRRRR